MHAIHPSIQHGGHGGAIERSGLRQAPVPAGDTTAPATGSTPVNDEITLSPEAKAVIDGEDHGHGRGRGRGRGRGHGGDGVSGPSANHGPGNSNHSAAPLARAAIVANPELAAMPFGRIVSGINHGVDFTPAAAPEPAPAPGPVDEGGDTPPADPVADAPDTGAPVVDEGTPPVVSDPNPLANIAPLVDPGPEVSLLETLDAAIDDAGDQTPDDPGGVDIAA